MDKIIVIRQSLAAFRCGVVSFIPVVGVIPAIITLLTWFDIRREHHRWNPAARYLKLGIAFAIFGLLQSGILTVVVLLSMAQRWWN